MAEAALAGETVDEITSTMQANLEKVNAIMDVWSAKPLMDRKPKPQKLDYFEKVFKQSKTNRYAEIKDGGKEIERMLKDTNKVLRVSNASLDWRAYRQRIFERGHDKGCR